MAKIIVYTTAQCPYCVRAKQLLDQKGTAYEEIRVDTSDEKRTEMMTRSGRRTVPQIFINEFHVGGCDELYELNRQGKLDELLKA